MAPRFRGLLLSSLLLGLPLGMVVVLSACAASPPRAGENEPAAQTKPTLNNPESGFVLFQLIDSETRKPVAFTEFQLARVNSSDDTRGEEMSGSYGYGNGRDYGTSYDYTSGEGMAVAHYRDWKKYPRDEKPGYEHGRDYSPAVDNGVSGFELPVPRGYEPAWNFDHVRSQIASFVRGENRDPIQVNVRRTCTLTGRVVDAFGQPVPRAAVFAFPTKCDGNESWLRNVSYFYNGEPDGPDDQRTWEAEQHLAAIRQTFENYRPVFQGLEGALFDKPNDDDQAINFAYVPSSYEKNGARWRTIADDKGNFTLREMPRGTWLVGGYDADWGFTTVSYDLRKPNADVVVKLPDDEPASLELTVEWKGELPFDRPKDGGSRYYVRIEVQPALPNGNGQQWAECIGYLSHHVKAPWRCVIYGLRPGLWNVRAQSFGSEDKSDATVQELSVELKPRENTEASMTAGPGIYGKLDVRFRADGKEIEKLPYTIESVDKGRPHCSECGTEGPSHNNVGQREVDLPAGNYRLRCITGFTNFRIEEGKTLQQIIDLPLVAMRFSLAQDLAAVLGKDPTLKLSAPLREPPSVFGCLEDQNGLAEVIEKLGYEHEFGEDRSVTLHLPPAVYSWELGDLEGAIDLRNETSASFSLESVPGMQSCVLDCSELRIWENEPSPLVPGWEEINSFQDGHYGSLFRAYVPKRGATPNSYPAAVSRNSPLIQYPTDAEYLDLLRDREGNRLICYSAMNQLGITIRVTINEVYCEANLRLTFPGQLKLTLAEFKPINRTRISFRGTGKDAAYSITPNDDEFVEVCREENGDWPRSPREFLVAPGRHEFLIQRDKRFGKWGEPGTWSFCRVVLDVGKEPVSVDLSKLKFELNGAIRVELVGAAPLDSTFDPWWHNSGFRAQTQVAIEALDFESADIKRYCITTAEMPGTQLPKPTLSAINDLPPGSYKIIPWPGAPESACKIVTVEPGKECVVRFEGR